MKTNEKVGMVIILCLVMLFGIVVHVIGFKSGHRAGWNDVAGDLYGYEPPEPTFKVPVPDRAKLANDFAQAKFNQYNINKGGNEYGENN